jgi:O-succinylbenzoic acid--CoA ligase
LLGGADCSQTLAKALIPLAERRYLGFGMTETGSHFALASLNPDDPACRTSGGQWMYHPVQGVRLVWKSEPASIVPLTLLAPHLGIDQPLQTNDLASPVGAGFVWWGRSDGAVNSAGIKLFPETIEAWVFQALPAVEGRGFATSVPDVRWGERLVWLSEPLDDDLRAEVQAVWVQLRQEHPHWVPKDTYEIPAIPRAAQGKVDRRALRALAVLRAQTEDKA